jgi:hypothetical protein
LEGNYTNNEITILEDIKDIGLIQILPVARAILAIEMTSRSLEISRNEIFGGE